MKNITIIAALIAAAPAFSYDYNYYPNYPNRYQREADRNESEIRRREQDNQLNALKDDLRYQQRIEQIDREHRNIYGDRINTLKPYDY